MIKKLLYDIYIFQAELKVKCFSIVPSDRVQSIKAVRKLRSKHEPVFGMEF